MSLSIIKNLRLKKKQKIWQDKQKIIELEERLNYKSIFNDGNQIRLSLRKNDLKYSKINGNR